MAARSLSDLRLPANTHRIDLHSSGFETREAAAREDALRAKLLRKQGAAHAGEWGKRALRLANLLDPGVTKGPQTLASFRYVRLLRIRVVGAISALCAANSLDIRRFDIVKAAWARDVQQLDDETPARLKAEFRAALNRAGASGDNGVLIACLHADFDPESGKFQLHFHGIACGDKLRAVERLREKRGYAVTRADRSTAPVAQPVRVSRKSLEKQLYALGYLLKGYILARAPDRRDPITGRKQRTRGSRVKEPYASHWLVWMHQFSLADCVLLMGVRVGCDGLCMT